MIKNVMELLEEINNGNFDELPERIKVNDEIFKKNDKEVSIYSNKDGVGLMKFLSGIFTLTEYLKLPITIVVNDNKKWKPQYWDEYYFIDDMGDLDSVEWDDTDADNYRYYTNNCFKTEKEAQNHLDNIKTEIELRELAEELNNGEKIDWEDYYQIKYYIYYNYENFDFSQGSVLTDKERKEKVVYCLDEYFKEKAIERIGKEKLKKYLITLDSQLSL